MWETAHLSLQLPPLCLELLLRPLCRLRRRPEPDDLGLQPGHVGLQGGGVLLRLLRAELVVVQDLLGLPVRLLLGEGGPLQTLSAALLLLEVHLQASHGVLRDKK